VDFDAGDHRLERANRYGRRILCGGARSHNMNFCYSNEKAKRELGWNPQPVRELWLETLQGERELKARRRKRNLQSRLMPLVDEV